MGYRAAEGTQHFPAWFRGTARSRCCPYCCEKTENSEFSVDFGAHGRLHTKWIDYCFRAELEFPDRPCSGSPAGMNNVFHPINSTLPSCYGKTQRPMGLGQSLSRKKEGKNGVKKTGEKRGKERDVGFKRGRLGEFRHLNRIILISAKHNYITISKLPRILMFKETNFKCLGNSHLTNSQQNRL